MEEYGVPKEDWKKVNDKRQNRYNKILLGGALFFGCRSCEYSKVNNDEDRKTDVLRLENLRFFKDYHEVTDINTIHQADFIEITFIRQKTRRCSTAMISEIHRKVFLEYGVWVLRVFYN